MAKLNLGKVTDKAKGLVERKGDKIASGVDKVTTKIDQKTKGKYHDKLEKIDQAAAKLDKTARPTEQAAAEPTEQADTAEGGEEQAAAQPGPFPEPS